MADILKKICAQKQRHIREQKEKMPLRILEQKITSCPPCRGFYQKLKTKKQSGNYGLITEIKKASPSRGLIRPDFHPKDLAKAYELGGASCLSILTDTPFFQGKDIYIQEAKSASSLPVLRKDFILDPYQVLESRAIGADCILLIVAALSGQQLHELESAAFSYGLDVLVEVHNEDELEKALIHTKTPLLGVNSRNLKTLEINLETALSLAPLIPQERLPIAESGLYTKEDLDKMATAGFSTFLIGQSLMEQENVTQATQALLGKTTLL